MLEKLLLAVMLTFSFNLFAHMNLSTPSQNRENVSSTNQEVLALTQLQK